MSSDAFKYRPVNNIVKLFIIITYYGWNLQFVGLPITSTHRSTRLQACRERNVAGYMYLIHSRNMYSRNPISLLSLMMMIIVTDTAQDYQASRRWGQRWTSDIRWTHSSEGGWWWQWWSLPPPSSGECEPHWLWSCAPRATSSKMPAPGRSKLQNNYVRRWVWCLRDALPPLCQSLVCNLISIEK